MMPSTKPDKMLHIAVVGGSLAGLMSAIPLRRLGHKVTILERSPVALLHDQGAGVVAGGDTLEWIQRHGKSKRSADDISVLSQWRHYLDKQGNVIDTENSHQRMTSWSVLYNLGRDVFDGGAATTGNEIAKYEYGRTVTGVVDEGNQIKLIYKQQRTGGPAEGEESTMLADFLIVADGPSSHLRKMLLGSDTAQRKYAGYVAFRGTVSESELADAARAAFVERFSFYHGANPNTQILAYTIPDSEGSLEKGRRNINWVWYHKVAMESDEYAQIMTDKDGHKHRFTMPTGGFISSKVWDRQKTMAEETLPPQFAELVMKTDKPFVQAITDLEPPKHEGEVAKLMSGKAVIVGDALSGFRPHTAASTSQAAFDALRLEEVFKGDLSWEGYAKAVFQYAVKLQRHGVRLGDRSQFGKHPLSA